MKRRSYQDEDPSLCDTIQGRASEAAGRCRRQGRRSVINISRKWTIVNSSGTELPRSYREQSPVNGGLGRDATPTAKRQLDATSSENDALPTKRARLTQTDTERLGVDKETEQAAKVWRAILSRRPATNRRSCRRLYNSRSRNLPSGHTPRSSRTSSTQSTRTLIPSLSTLLYPSGSSL